MENDAEERGTRRCRNEVDWSSQQHQLQEDHDSRTTVAHDFGGQQQELKESSVALCNACKKLLQEFPSLGSRFCQYEEVGAVCDMCQRAVSTTLGVNALEDAELENNRCFHDSLLSPLDEDATAVRGDTMVATVSFDSTSSLSSSCSSSGDDEESSNGSTSTSYSHDTTCSMKLKRPLPDEDWHYCTQKKERKLANGAGAIGGTMMMIFDEMQEQVVMCCKEAKVHREEKKEDGNANKFLSKFAAFALAVLDVSFARLEYQCALVERARRLFALPSEKALTAAAAGEGDEEGEQQLGQVIELLQHYKEWDHAGEDYCSMLRHWRYLLLHRNAAATLQHMPAASV
jgi:hypothetical protein